MRARRLAAVRARRLAAVAAVILALPAATLLTGAADAAGLDRQLAQASDSPAEAPASLSLDLARIDGFVQPGGTLRLRVQVANRSRQDRGGLRLVLTMHQRTRWRSEYHQAVDAGVLGAVVHAHTVDVAPVPARGARTVDLAHGDEELGLAGMVERGLEGVYPVRLRLLEGDEVAGELVTAVVASAARPAAPLATALVLELAHGPSRDATGAFVDLGIAAELAPGGALGSVLDALAARGDVPLTLVADALALEEVSDLAAGFVVPAGTAEPGEPGAPGAGDAPHTVRPASSPESVTAREFLSRLREVMAGPGVELVPLPYASADLVALTRAGLGSEAARHVTEGARALEAATGRRPGDVLVPPDGLDDDALARLAGTGPRAVLLSPGYLATAPITGPTPSSLRRLRSGTGTSVPALVDDPWLEQALARSHATPALAAQRILAELATIYFERPSRAGRGVLLRLPPERALALVETAGEAPFLRPLTLTRFLQVVGEEDEPVRLDYPADARERELPTTYVATLRAARRSLGSLDGVLVDDRATPGRFDRLLLQAASTHHRAGGTPERGLELLEAVTSTVEDLYARVEVPETPAVTLTSVEGQLPVTVRSTAEVPLRVRVRLRTARLEVDGGPTREIVLDPGGTHVLMLPVRALNPGGTAPVDVQVTDVDGEIVLATGQVVVRSTAVSGTAVVVVAGAALFLLVWLLQEVARRRQRRAGPGAGPRPVESREDPAASPPRRPLAGPARAPAVRPPAEGSPDGA